MKNSTSKTLMSVTGRLILSVAALLLLVPLSMSAQSKLTLGGTIKDSAGFPMPGVNVFIKGTAQGTASSTDGSFRLEAPRDATIVFSFIGYENNEIPAPEVAANPDIVLQDKISSLDEVVVVGYGTQKKVSLTGAVSSIKSEEILTTKNENMINMLTGKIPGFRVIQTSGEPGSFSTNMAIRGFGNPLVIVDGVPRNNMPKLNANAIESVTVLKDGAAAVYGVRAQNGVVLITTKKGKKGQVALEYSYSIGLQTPINTPKGLNAWQYMEITNENNIMRGSLPAGQLVYSQQAIDDYRSGRKTGTEWWKINSDFYAPVQNHNVQVSGGTEVVDYFVNFGYMDQQGLYTTGDLNYNQYELTTNIGTKITQNLRADFNIFGLTSEKNSPYNDVTNFWKAAWTFRPTTPAYANYDPKYMQNVEQGYNPLAITDSDISGFRKNAERKVQVKGSLTWDVPWVEGLQAGASYAYDYNMWENKSLQKPYMLYDYDLNNDEYISSMYSPLDGQESSSVRRDFSSETHTLMNVSLRYDKTFGDHHVNGLVLYEETEKKTDNLFASGYIDMTAIEYLFGITGTGAAGQNGGNLKHITTKALVTRINYDYKDRYYGEFAFRYDGSSYFHKDKRWGFFPSASAGWRISEEPFLKESSALSFVDNLKLRASYGVTGSDATALYTYLDGYNYPGVSRDWWGFLLDGVPREMIDLKATPNKNLSWIEYRNYNVGLDGDMWNGLLGFSVDFFIRDSHGEPATRTGTLPDWIGESFAQENLNKKSDRGFEIALSHNNTVKGVFRYSISGNIGFTRRKNKHITRVEDDNQYLNWRNNPNGRWTDIWWGYTSQGQFQNYEEIWSHAKYIAANTGNSELKPGDYKYLDWNEDGVIDELDVHPIRNGNSSNENTPKIYYGFNISAEYKGFDFNAQFNGGALSSIMYDWILARPFISDQNGPDFFYNRWRMADPTADPKDPRTVWVPGRLPTTSQGSQAMSFNAAASESTINRSGYLRCKSMELGYTLPAKVTDFIGLKSVRVYCNAYNLFTITSLKYLDPEHPSSNYGLVYPLTRTITFGANIKF